MAEAAPLPSDRLPTLTRTSEDSTGDLVWTLRIPSLLVTDPRAVELVKLRIAAWMLRLMATAIEDLP